MAKPRPVDISQREKRVKQLGGTREAERQAQSELLKQRRAELEATPGTAEFESKVRKDLETKQAKEKIETQFAAEQIDPSVKAAQEKSAARQDEEAEEFPIDLTEKTRKESLAAAGFASAAPIINTIKGIVGQDPVTPEQFVAQADPVELLASSVIGFITTTGVNIGGANLRIAELLASKNKQIKTLNSDIADISTLARIESQNLGSKDTDIIISNLEDYRDSTREHLFKIEDLMRNNPEDLANNADIAAEARKRLAFIDQKILDAEIFKATGRKPSTAQSVAGNEGGENNAATQ